MKSKKILQTICFSAVFYLVCNMAFAAAGVQCRDQNGEPVDWWVIVKLPTKISPTPQPNGYGYFYLDSTKQPVQYYPDGDRGLDKPNQALYYTRNQIYDAYDNSSADIGWLMYNDSNPATSPPFCYGLDNPYVYSHNCGHAKGFFAFDQNTGFWMVHSITEFPLAATKDLAYQYSSSPLYGQSALCMSLPANYAGINQFNLISKQLKFVNPAIYNFNLPAKYDTKMPDMQDIIANPQRGITIEPDHNTISLYSLADVEFTNIVETNPYPNDNALPFYQYSANQLLQNLTVQSWLNSNTPLNAICNMPYIVNQVKSLSTAKVGNNVPVYTWSTTIDHSKWAVSDDSYADAKSGSQLACIGDINNTLEQEKRGGGTVCFNDQNVHDFLAGMITDKLTCPYEKNLSRI